MDAREQRGHRAVPAGSAGITEHPVSSPPSSSLVTPLPSQGFLHRSAIPPHPPLLLQPPLPPQGSFLEPALRPESPQLLPARYPRCTPGLLPDIPLSPRPPVLSWPPAGDPRVPPALSPRVLPRGAPMSPRSPLTFAASRSRPLPTCAGSRSPAPGPRPRVLPLAEPLPSFSPIGCRSGRFLRAPPLRFLQRLPGSAAPRARERLVEGEHWQERTSIIRRAANEKR